MNLYNLIIQDKEQINFNDVFLNEGNKEILVQLIREHTYIKELQEYGLPVNNKILLQGSSGCGKTMTAKALAHALGKNIIILNLSNIVSSRIGETSQNIKMIFDKAKRLMDYGFHAPTVSFPVAGTLMIEPTESESKAEIDRFAEALISIKKEIDEIANGEADATNNVLKNAPHTEQMVISDSWDKPYSREKAAYPLEWVRDHKFFASVSRVDEAYGDRNLVCTCEPIEAYM